MKMVSLTQYFLRAGATNTTGHVETPSPRHIEVGGRELILA